MKQEVVHIIVDDIERRIIVNALVKLKELQIKEDKHYEFLDEIITKVCNAPIKMEKIRFYEQR